MTLTIHTLLNPVKLAAHPSPHSVHIGFMKPIDIQSVADIPYFLKTTPNSQIATNLKHTPVKEWQRYPDQERISRIQQIFAAASDIMPNAVLLCENIYAPLPRQVVVHSANVLPVPNLQIVSIPTTATSPDKPLWVIDGQHRVEGLARANLDQPIPVVLLLNDQEKYTGDQVAKIFAQVTTGAEPLDPLHDEWMSYAFELGNYAHPTDGPTHKLAMETVVHLCCMPTLPGGVANPFYSQIQFNPHLTSFQPQFGGAVTHGFAFRCTDLERLLHKAYFANTSTPLTPQLIAEQVGLSVKALSFVVGNPVKSVFFGDKSSEQQIVSQAFLWGVLNYLRTHAALATVADWENELRQLKFAPPTSWEFDWINSLSGQFNTRSRDVVRTVFTNVFEHRALPGGVTDIPNYLRGGQASITFRFSRLTPTGQASRREGTWWDEPVVSGYTGTLSATKGDSENYHVRLTEPSWNVAGVRITDKGASPGTIIDLTDDFESGTNLKEYSDSGKLKLYVELEFYGGTKKSADVDITW